MDSDIAERLLSKPSRKWQRCNHTAPKLPTKGMISLPDTTPMDSRPGYILPLIGFTKVSEEGSDPPLPTTCVDTFVPMTSSLPPWGKGDYPSTWKIQAWTEIMADL